MSRIATVQQRALADGDVNWVIAVLKTYVYISMGKRFKRRTLLPRFSTIYFGVMVLSILYFSTCIR